MQFKKVAIQGLIEIYPAIFEDDRGLFFESFHSEKFQEAGIKENFIQSNQSFSKKGVLRGLHFQRVPFAQGKLVRVISGQVLDIAVDLRKESPTFGQYHKCLLSAKENNMLYIPDGFAHGFAALEDSIFFYMCTNVYNKDSEDGIIWNDSDLNIDWGIDNPIISDKDLILSPFAELKKTL
ncbi:dTDP-4-dehydrorhamnose 3,5-epimerase [Fulvivirgaceae bacterium BMA10]|uniref:dTDP-4-dehydrorhamnose 3,5-epimerase n=1 Tax=Splendidivirga corallicola TaxID=3051826 RepID=A0ABT8KSY8_9BACT|nr:dTDP-4-dehydrorhamnose 3,5-epimerase [Fulvivirgaceae bacterium BMA10]